MSAGHPADKPTALCVPIAPTGLPPCQRKEFLSILTSWGLEQYVAFRVCVCVFACVHVCVCACAQSCLTLFNPKDCSPPGSSVHGILQARILEWVAISSSKGYSWPRDQTRVSVSPALDDRFFTTKCHLGRPHRYLVKVCQMHTRRRRMDRGWEDITASNTEGKSVTTEGHVQSSKRTLHSLGPETS